MKTVLMIIILALIVQYSFGQQFTDLYGNYLGQTPPGDTPVVFAPGIISTQSLEHSAAIFTPDGNEVYWYAFMMNEISAPHHIRFMKRINNRWTKPEAFLPFGDSIHYLDPFISLDGKKLYFSAKVYKKHEIWFVEKNGDGWGTPKSADTAINNADYQGQPALNSSGTLYYLSSSGIARSKFKNGQFQKPEILSFNINLDKTDLDPCIAPDDSYLIFASMRRNCTRNLYISFHDTISDRWSEPINFGEPINGICTRFAAISPDGKYLFFTRYNGEIMSQDIFWVSANIIDRLREKSRIKK